MGDLKVASKTDYQKPFHVNVKGNVKIKNYDTNRAPKDNEFNTTVKNGQVSTYYKRSNQAKPVKEDAITLNSKNYLIFDGIRKADKTDKAGKQLSRSDLEAIRKDKTLQKKLGIQKVEVNEKAGIYTVRSTSGSVLSFDFD
ncbi:MAG TPA: hypothetical protein DEO94_04700 [Cyanobacteria bacterium UBA11991]|nr:hypothetical protein [Cyanobacteriota bacterium]MDY6358695.1 hypothetical protein [Cyanobacteriota bacterium]MDY6363650.1 hypothetical protein [Cyanobacteriota bacterium]MDY6382592.1 hypothetical protein [Cyanobacteriota bacterium]HCB11428.1 hypothetical protein [Cyanobacteria bacterium UBA11991]